MKLHTSAQISDKTLRWVLAGFHASRSLDVLSYRRDSALRRTDFPQAVVKQFNVGKMRGTPTER